MSHRALAEVRLELTNEENSHLKSASRDSAELSGPANKFEEEDQEEEYEFNCDGCGAGPIVDNRCNSLEKDDYDLCKTCYDSEWRNPRLWVCVKQHPYYLRRNLRDGG